MPNLRPVMPDPSPSDGDRRTGGRFIIISSILIIPATILVTLRLYIRTQITRTLGLDDFFLVLSLLLTLVTFVFVVVAVEAGEGRHIYYLSLNQILRVSKFLHFAIPFFTLATACSRLSISLFLLHIVTGGARRWRYILYGLITFAALNYLALFIVGWLHCHPVQRLWDPLVPGECWSEVAQSAMNIWDGVFSTVYDFVLAIVPVIFLWNVQISLRRKIGICALMGFGTVTGGCAVARTVLSVHSINARPDATWNTMDEVIWAAVEAFFLIIAATIPTVLPLFKRSRYRRRYTTENERSDRVLNSKSSKIISTDPPAIDHDDNCSLPTTGPTTTLELSDFVDSEMQPRAGGLVK